MLPCIAPQQPPTLHVHSSSAEAPPTSRKPEQLQSLMLAHVKPVTPNIRNISPFAKSLPWNTQQRSWTSQTARRRCISLRGPSPPSSLSCYSRHQAFLACCTCQNPWSWSTTVPAAEMLLTMTCRHERCSKPLLLHTVGNFGCRFR